MKLWRPTSKRWSYSNWTKYWLDKCNV